MKARFLKKLSILSTIKWGLALQHPNTGNKISSRDDDSPQNGIPDLSDGVKGLEDDQDTVESVNDFEDAYLSAPESENSSEGEFSTGFETCSPQDAERPREGDAGSVVFYSTSLRGVRKTFQDCSRVRFLLRSLRVRFEERDVSMHQEYREELWKVSGCERAVPPKLFVRGRLIGGADEVIALHERGELRELLQGIPLDPSAGHCEQCGSFRFVICSSCSGSCKIVAETEKKIRCTECNENGLVRCPVC